MGCSDVMGGVHVKSVAIVTSTVSRDRSVKSIAQRLVPGLVLCVCSSLTILPTARLAQDR